MRSRRALSHGFPRIARPLSALLLLCAVALLVADPPAVWAQAPALVSATAPDARTVRVTFSKSVDPFTGGTASNYQIFETATPASTVVVSAASVNAAVATLTLGSDLASSTGYTVRVQNVEDLQGNPIAAGSTVTFTLSSGPSATPIATIQNNLRTYKGQVVTIQGQVYIPSNYRGGTTYSGYIQDGSGRGINLFGSTTNDPQLQNRGNVVLVTGTVDTFFTTIEVVTLTQISLVSGGNAPLTPVQLGTGAAASHSYEGTYIQVSGTISAKAVTNPGAANEATNYTVSDGSGNIVVRVVTALGAPAFNVGQTIRAAGAGAQFQTDYQILVGNSFDIALASGGDTTPPTVTSASASSATQAVVHFSEAVTLATGQVAANYQVFQTATPANTVTVTAASLSGDGLTATLTLGSALPAGVGHTVRVSNVQDLAGNAVAAGAGDSATFTYTPSNAIPIATIQNNLRTYKGQVVTIQGQVYIPSNYRGSTTYSGYIQDGSGRGINLFGSTSNDPQLQNRGNVVLVTGTVDTFFTTIEVVTLTQISLVSGGNVPLTPLALSTGAARSTSYEGTYINVTGPITAKAVTNPGAANEATNYTVNDGSGNVLVRVVTALGAPAFNVGQTIRAAGAGAQFQTDFQVLVGVVGDIAETTSGGDTTPPTVTSAAASSASQVLVSFSEAVTGATANLAANYEVFRTVQPTSTVPVSAASLGSGISVTLTLGGSLAENVGYTVRVHGLQDLAGNAIVAGSGDTATFTHTASGAIPIAAIHNNLHTYKGQAVTIQGQVYIPNNYRGSTTSGYIQDDSGRGVNLFGSSAGSPLLRDRGNIVLVKGTVDTFFTTIEITGITEVTLVSGGNTPLKPTPLSTGTAASHAWEGTYIRVTGQIVAKSVTNPGAANEASNYTVNDGSGPIVVRVVTALGAAAFNVGNTIWASGAGSQFQSDFQVLVGVREEITDQPPPDDIPPTLLRASLTGRTELTLKFNEALDPATIADVAHYTVYRTQVPTETVAVQSARAGQDATQVVLGLAAELAVAQGWSVRVAGVADPTGNAIAAPGVVRPVEEGLIDFVTLVGPPKTFLPREGEAYPITFTVPATVVQRGSDVLLRVFDLTGRLRKTLYDSRFSDPSAVFTNNRATVSWDGRDDTVQIVEAGAYVVHLLVSDRTTGRIQTMQMPVVVATRLQR